MQWPTPCFLALAALLAGHACSTDDDGGGETTGEHGDATDVVLDLDAADACIRDERWWPSACCEPIHDAVAWEYCLPDGGTVYGHGNPICNDFPAGTVKGSCADAAG